MTYFAGLFAASMVGFGYWANAPWYAMLPMVGALLGMGWLLAANVQSGAQLTVHKLRFYHGRLDRIIALADVASVERHVWSEGPDDITLILKDGERVAIPSQSVDRQFVAALKTAGLKLDQ